jgi:tetratricopeptide (TPR) repeat protein
VSTARRTTWLVAAVIAVVALAAYANSLGGPFVYDDVSSIPDNPSIRDLSRLGEVLNPPATDGRTVGGRPFLNLTLALNHAISGTDVWSYHALNLLIHLAAGLTLFGIVRRLLASQAALAAVEADWIAATVALLWTVHPLQTEAVTYTIQRAESLMGLLYLQTLYAFIRTTETPGSRLWPTWCLGACVLGMMTKEVMVSAPVLLLLYARTFVAGSFREAWRLRRGLYLRLALTWIPLGLLVASHGGNRGGSIGFGGSIGWWEHGLTQFEAVSRYLWLSFWPHPLVFDYGPQRIAGARDVVPYLIPVAAVAWLTVRGFWQRTALGFAGVWFFAILAPTSIIPGPTQMTVEHRMYLPLAAVLAVTVITLHRLAGRRVLWGGVAVAAVFAGLTIARNRDYRTELALWEDTMKKRPDNPVAVGAYGATLMKENRLTEARAALERAAQLGPWYWDIQGNLGSVLAKQERFPEAVEAYQRALQSQPNRTAIRENLARALVRLGRIDDAAAEYRRVVATPPGTAESHGGLGICLMLQNRPTEAIDHFQAALRLNPADAETELNLGNALALTGQPAAALPHFEAALRIRPDFVEAACNLADALFLLRRPAEAVARYESALASQPGNAMVHARFGALLAQLQRGPEAITHLSRAVQLQPAEGGFRLPLADVLLQTGRVGEAVPQLETFLRLNPAPAEAVQAHTLLGTAYRRLGDPARATAEFQAALRIDPNYAPARDGLRGI